MTNNLIQLKTTQIAGCIYNKVEKQTIDPLKGLYNGDLGMLLFLFYYASYSNDPKYVLLTENFAEKVVNKLDTIFSQHSFSCGLAGGLYLFEFLRENSFIDIDFEDAETALENSLIYDMREDIRTTTYDFMHGALGIGLYFLKKNINQEPIQEIIKFLYKTAEKDTKNKIFKWTSRMNPRRINEYNISLSHGIASIVIFLTHAMKNKVNSPVSILEMLEGAINYLFTQEMDIKIYASYFPTHINEKMIKSRLAWCYGDLGVGYAIWYAGRNINNKIWEQRGLNILLMSTKRLEVSENNVIDAGICHGAVGIAMIYRRLYLETSHLSFLHAMDHWINEALKFSYFDDGLAGYKSYLEKGWSCDYSLLTGISGVGLMFLSFLKNDLQKWDEMFLLS